MSYSFTTMTSTGTIDVGYSITFFNCSNGNITATIPMSQFYGGSYIMLKRLDTDMTKTCTIVTSDSSNIDGSASKTLAIYGLAGDCLHISKTDDNGVCCVLARS